MTSRRGAMTKIDNGLKRGVDGRDRQRYPRVAAQVACFERARTGEEDDSVAAGAEINRSGMGRAVWQDSGEVRDRRAVEYAAHVGIKHGCTPSARVAGAPGDVSATAAAMSKAGAKPVSWVSRVVSR